MNSMLRVILLALLWAGLFLALAVHAGWAAFTIQAEWLANPAELAFRHLRWSLVPFGLLFLLYLGLMARMQHLVHADQPVLHKLTFTDRMLNAVISAFFGVGVIWTAIGMETALLHALRGVSANGAESLTAWDLLDGLVNGGLLLALSTTVFGGVCGYGLRLLKIMLLGSAWDKAVLAAEGARP